MQTFLPEPSFRESAARLDLKRLNKQIIEAGQIIRMLFDSEYGGAGFQAHPATAMWRGYPAALLAYTRSCRREWWLRRGKYHKAYDNVLLWLQERDHLPIPANGLPPWLGWPALHMSHQSNLMRKDPDWYGKWYSDIEPDLEYVWPGRYDK